MKFLIAFACLLAAASAGYIQSPLAYTAGSSAVAYNAPLVSSAHPVYTQAYAGPIAQTYAAQTYAAPIAQAYAAPIAYAAPVAVAATTSNQYHAQDELGQYTYGYSNINSAKQESRAYDGTTVGGYSYVDGHGLIQSVKYQADALGFRAAGTNIPVGPNPVGIPETVEVVAAKAAHFQAHANAKAHLIAKRSPIFSTLGYATPYNYGYSAYASPLAYSGYPYYG